MISIGGVIGTGLFLGTGGALANGGPLGLLLGYTIMGSVCLCVMVGLGEMCSYLPIEGGHVALAHRFGTSSCQCFLSLARSLTSAFTTSVDPAWAFALSFNYAYNWLIILPVELAAVAILVGYWTTAINNAVWISIAMVVVVIINLFGSRGYGEAEFWFASIKVLTIIGLIFVGIIINVGYGDGGYLGFTYWKDPGPFVQYQGIAGTLGQFLGFWAVLIQAAFSFIGTEIVAIASGETENPRRNLPKAIKRVYIRILLFYILGVFIIGIITVRALFAPRMPFVAFRGLTLPSAALQLGRPQPLEGRRLVALRHCHREGRHQDPALDHQRLPHLVGLVGRLVRHVHRLARPLRHRAQR